ncbi:low temperature requirement protein A [Micromonospora phytophila]|uniref:low temperature requirement protein A n=1 Tax=Micromonospora phytophila TaxID=709888 RepID=UPI00202EDB56|nr:low temperature requirement protein A [Micromonospora phytophila]MCM0676748.1 low temperature requirement protein A [Micromonospora phytophila]
MRRGAGGRWPTGIRPSAPGARATRLELFYDLVFVFAFLNVTTLTAGNPTPGGLVQCLIVLALLWWCWTAFAAFGNVVRTDQGVVPLVGFATTAAAFVFALAMPQAFRDNPGGLNGPLVFAVCYFLVRASQVAAFGWVARGDPVLRRQWLLLSVPVVIATGLILTASTLPQRFVEGSAEVGLRLGLWIAAIAVEYGVGLVLRGTGWTVISAGHWAERHALIVLVALGESVIALGLGPGLIAGLSLTWPIIIGAVLGIAVVAGLWWAYFDTLALALEQALHRTRDVDARVALARDAYTYLHLPLVAGIILFALGLKGLLDEGADPSNPAWGLPLPGFDLLALYGGVALYLLGLVALGWRALRALRWPSIGFVLLLAASAPLAARLPELIALGLLGVVVVALTAVQTAADAPLRGRVRQVALQEQYAAEADQTRWRGEHL